jgi:hypothetical protein
MVKKDLIVTPFFGNWAIKIEGKDTPISIHNLKSEAIRVANQAAKRLKTKTIIETTQES